jgi:hypothetical protein
MIEHRVDINLGEISSDRVPLWLVDQLAKRGRVTTVIEGAQYYWETKKSMEGFCAYLNARPGISISRLQGELLNNR